MNGLRAHFGQGSYQWQELRAGGAPRIFADTMTTKVGIMTWLERANVQFNSYAQNTLKRKSYLLRGMAGGDDTSNQASITNALRTAGIVGEIVVGPFVTGYMRRNLDKQHARLYRCTLEHDVSDKVIGDISSIGEYRVRFEVMRKSKNIQCKRCQRFAHTAALCASNYRCVQCTHQHLPGGNCPRKENSSLPLGCVNCLAEGLPHDGHTANDLRNCKYYIKRSGGDGTASAGTTCGTGGSANSSPSKRDGIKPANEKPANGPASIANTRETATTTRANASTAASGLPAQNVIIESVIANNPHSGPTKSKSKSNSKSKSGSGAGKGVKVDARKVSAESGTTRGSTVAATHVTSANDTKCDGGLNELIRRLTEVLNTFSNQ